MQHWHQPFSVLRAQMTVKASKDPNYNTFKDELQLLIQEQDAFLAELYIWIQECDALDKAGVTSFFLLNKKEYIYIYIALANHTKKKHQANEELFDANLARAQEFSAALTAHSAGCQTSSTRFAGILGIPPPKP